MARSTFGRSRSSGIDTATGTLLCDDTELRIGASAFLASAFPYTGATGSGPEGFAAVDDEDECGKPVEDVLPRLFWPGGSLLFLLLVASGFCCEDDEVEVPLGRLGSDPEFRTITRRFRTGEVGTLGGPSGGSSAVTGEPGSLSLFCGC